MATQTILEALDRRQLFSALPAGFTDTVIAAGLDQPTTSLALPDGRVLVTQKTGALRVIKYGALLPVPSLQLAVDSTVERGLLCAAIDPGFSTDHFIYLNYQAAGNNYNQISRFTMSGDGIIAGSEVKIFQIDPQLNNAHHVGGGMVFGADGKLYIGVGDNEVPADSQSLATLHGKLLRINADGTIPADNPYAATLTGPLAAIYAIGLRNPFTLGVDPATGKMLINDVGSTKFEEIDVARAGANYGWPNTEGPTSDPAYDTPLYSYPPPPDAPVVPGGGGTAITGAAFYSGVTQQFPAAYKGQYFFGDFENGFIKTLDPATGVATPFATGVGRITDLDVMPDGTLLATTYDGSVHAIKYTAPTPPTPAVTAAISGYLWNDSNGNAVKDGSETFTGSRTVFIDANRNGKLDAGELQTTSDADGNYGFKNLAAGTYYVSRVFPTGYHLSNNSSGYVAVTATAGQNTAGVNIGTTGKTIAPTPPPPPISGTASIAGVLWNDSDSDGLFDANETYTGARTVFLDANRNGMLDAGEVQVTSDAMENYAFKNLGAGTYYVTRLFPTGYHLSNNKIGYVSVTLTSSQNATGINLGTAH